MVQYKYILEAIEKSYSHKPHLAGLPYDLNTNDPEKLKERLKANNKALREAKKDLKNAEEMDEMMEQNIKDIDNETELRNEEIQKLTEENNRITEAKSKIYDHFEDVTMMTEEDGWEIKKQYDKMKDFDSYWEKEVEKYWEGDEPWNTYFKEAKRQIMDEVSDTPLPVFDDDMVIERAEQLAREDFKIQQKEIGDNMNEFIDEVSLLGYIPDTYPKDDSIYAERYIKDKFNPMINHIKLIDSPEAKKLAELMIDYRDKYDISKDTPLRRQLERIEDEGGLTDTYEDTFAKNNKNIEMLTQANIKENERKEGIIERQKENRREIGKLTTRVNDHEAHELKILEKLERLGEV